MNQKMSTITCIATLLVVGFLLTMFRSLRTADDSVNLATIRVQEACKLSYEEAMETLLDEGLTLILMGEGKMILTDNAGNFYGFKRKEDGSLTGMFFPDLPSCEDYLWK